MENQPPVYDVVVTDGAAGRGEQVVPRDQHWDVRELVVAGTVDGTLDYLVRTFWRGTGGG